MTTRTAPFTGLDQITIAGRDIILPEQTVPMSAVTEVSAQYTSGEADQSLLWLTAGALFAAWTSQAHIYAFGVWLLLAALMFVVHLTRAWLSSRTPRPGHWTVAATLRQPDTDVCLGCSRSKREADDESAADVYLPLITTEDRRFAETVAGRLNALVRSSDDAPQLVIDGKARTFC